MTAAVLRCSDTAGEPSGDLCAARKLPTAGAERVVVSCRLGATRRDSLVAAARRSGLHPSGVRVVAGDSPDQEILIEAALAEVSHADLNEPVYERSRTGPGPVSRRSLLGLDRRPRQAVAFHRGDRCDGRCRAWISACPSGALKFAVKGGTVVDPSSCTGCGACLSAGCLSLNGVTVAGLEAAARILAGAARDRGSGITLVCRDAEFCKTDDDWLPLVVPSLHMVTSGWIQSFRQARIPLAAVGCPDCGGRTAELADLVNYPVLGEWEDDLNLRHPLAGEVSVDAAACSGCGACARECPSGALGTTGPQLDFDAADCTACGLCVSSCPERAIVVRRGATMAGRRVLASVDLPPLCRSCGRPLAGGIPLAMIAARLADSHPQLARQLQEAAVCRDCVLRESQWIA